jgi:hypothetical protein
MDQVEANLYTYFILEQSMDFVSYKSVLQPNAKEKTSPSRPQVSGRPNGQLPELWKILNNI